MPNSVIELDESHNYTKDGIDVPGVTRIVGVIDKSEVLLPWGLRLMAQGVLQGWEDIETKEDLLSCLTDAYRAPEVYKDYKGEIGSRVHDIIEEFILTGTIVLSEEEDRFVHRCIRDFTRFVEDYEAELLFSEEQVYSEDYGYAGTADAGMYVTIYGKRLHVLGDFKTSSAIYPEYFLQAAAYAKAKEEDPLCEPYDGVLIVRLPGYEVQLREDVDELFDVFLSAKKIYEYKNSF